MPPKQKPKPFFADEAAAPRASRPRGMRWPKNKLPKQVSVLALCHLLEAADGRAAPAQVPTAAPRGRSTKRSRVASEAEATGVTCRPGPPPLAAIIAAQSLHFSRGACAVLLDCHVNKEEGHISSNFDGYHSIHRECLHCLQWEGAKEQRAVRFFMLAYRVEPSAALPYVSAVPTSELDRAAIGTVSIPQVLDAVLDHAEVVDVDVVKAWSFSDSLLHRAVEYGSASVAVVLRHGAFDSTLTCDKVVSYAKEKKMPMSDEVWGLLLEYLGP